ncbi:MAG: transketolase C-terminal domain-containing protein, partial [Terriglobales bacterium]
RQALPTLDRTKYASAGGVAQGGYILADAEGGKPEVILIATGSEVSLCVNAYETLKQSGIRARVVSLPCWELFQRQEEGYRNQVLPPEIIARVAVEQAASLGWAQYVGTKGCIIAMSSFGASAPLKDLQKKFGFTVDAVVKKARELVGK